MPTTNFYLSSEEYSELDKIAREEGITVPKKTREILEQWLKQRVREEVTKCQNEE